MSLAEQANMDETRQREWERSKADALRAADKAAKELRSNFGASANRSKPGNCQPTAHYMDELSIMFNQNQIGYCQSLYSYF